VVGAARFDQAIRYYWGGVGARAAARPLSCTLLRRGARDDCASVYSAEGGWRNTTVVAWYTRVTLTAFALRKRPPITNLSQLELSAHSCRRDTSPQLKVRIQEPTHRCK